RPPQWRADGVPTDGLCRTGLAFLPADALLGVLDALALVRLGRAERTHLHGDRPDELLVVGAQGQADGRHAVLGPLLLVHLGRHTLGEIEGDGVAEAQVEVNGLALDLGAETDAADVEATLEALAHAFGGVGEDRAGQAVHGAALLLVVLAGDVHDAILDLDGDA